MRTFFDYLRRRAYEAVLAGARDALAELELPADGLSRASPAPTPQPVCNCPPGEAGRQPEPPPEPRNGRAPSADRWSGPRKQEPRRQPGKPKR